MTDLVYDLKYALRMLRNSPAFTVVAVLSLALGIGANAAIFTLVNAVMLKYLPVRDPQQLVQVTMGQTPGAANDTYFTFAAWEELRNRQDVFSGLLAWGRTRYNLASGGDSVAASGVLAAGDYFSALGVNAFLGRLFTAADDHTGCPAIAVLSYDFWQRNYGADAAAVGGTIHLDRHPFQIVGVTPPGFFGLEVGSRFDVAAPMCTLTLSNPTSNSLTNRRTWWLNLVGRPKPGLSPQQVSARLKILAPQVFEASLPLNATGQVRESHLRHTLDILPAGRGLSFVRSQYATGLLVLMAVVGAVLLIACTNIANLLLARAAVRRREMAVRLAIGASRGRLVRQLLTESVLLSLLGALMGAIFASWASPLLVRFISQSRSRVSLDLSIDARVLAFTIGVSVLTGVLFGLAPALRSASLSPNHALKNGSRGSTDGRSRFGLGKALVVSQVALSLVLLIGSALLVRTFRNLLSLDAGFRRDNVLLASTDLRNLNLPAEPRAALIDEMIQRIRAIPRVLHASRSNTVPISGGSITTSIQVDGYTPRSRQDTEAYYNNVSPDYFSTMGTALLAGRDFDSRDRKGAPRVVIVNEALARKFFAGRNPIGRTFYLSDEPQPERIEIVGLVKDAKYTTLRDEAPPTLYVPMAQSLGSFPFANLEIAAAAAPADLIPSVRQAIAQVNPGIVTQYNTLASQIDDSLVRERLMATISGFFGVLAVLLATIGLYGVMAYMVTRRRGEIGIRMALGAQQPAVLKLVLREGATLIATGLAIGLAVSLGVTQVLDKMLYGLKPTDPPTIAMAMALLAGVALFAGYLPARRASRIDPMAALREE